MQLFLSLEAAMFQFSSGRGIFRELLLVNELVSQIPVDREFWFSKEFQCVYLCCTFSNSDSVAGNQEAIFSFYRKRKLASSKLVLEGRQNVNLPYFFIVHIFLVSFVLTMFPKHLVENQAMQWETLRLKPFINNQATIKYLCDH